MGISRSGYYKWKKRGKSDRDIQRRELIALVDTVHAEHRSHGYRWTAAYIRQQYGYECSDNFVYKCFRYLGIKAETKHQVHYRKRKIKDTYPNLIFTTWGTVDRPRQVIVSDMTAFKFWIFYFEVTFYFDVFTKEILAYRIAARKGDRYQYINGLEDVKELLKELSDFSHAQTVTLVPVNPAEFLTTVLSCQKNTLDYLGIRLEIHVEHTSSPVFLDRIKMRQVIFNLIKNSCEAIDQPGGKIIVNLTPADSGICICIKDNGCGMTHKQTENIFHPFITYKPEGTGLGLAVTAEIISAHHGQIRVSSTPGQGSAFYIYLPASPE